MVELLIGFVCFCGLSLLNAPWSTVPLLLPLFGSVPTDLAQCLTVVLTKCETRKQLSYSRLGTGISKEKVDQTSHLYDSR
jgi:hypothetical protein